MNNTGETIVKKWFNDYVNTMHQNPKNYNLFPIFVLNDISIPFTNTNNNYFQSNLIIFYSAKKELSVMRQSAGPEQLISVHWKMLKKAFCRQTAFLVILKMLLMESLFLIFKKIHMQHQKTIILFMSVLIQKKTKI